MSPADIGKRAQRLKLRHNALKERERREKEGIYLSLETRSKAKRRGKGNASNKAREELSGDDTVEIVDIHQYKLAREALPPRVATPADKLIDKALAKLLEIGAKPARRFATLSLEQVDRGVRQTECRHHVACVDFGDAVNWESFSCEVCPAFHEMSLDEKRAMALAYHDAAEGAANLRLVMGGKRPSLPVLPIGDEPDPDAPEAA